MGVIEADSFREIEELLELSLGFAREACDERRTQDDVGHGGPQLPHERHHLFDVVRALHAAKGGFRAVLEGHVEVVEHVGDARHRFDQLRADAARVGVHEPKPDIGADGFGEHLQEAREAAAHRQAHVFAPGRAVLRDEHEFFRARGDEALSFAHKHARRGGTKQALNLGDDAERAGGVAAVADLEVRARAVDRKSVV